MSVYTNKQSDRSGRVSVDDETLTHLRDQIGARRVEHLGEVTGLMIRRYARAVGETDPCYLDRDVALAHGHIDLIAPPNLLPAIVGWGDGGPEEDLRPDGTEIGEHLPGIPNEGLRLMGGGEDMTFHRDVVAGTRVNQAITLEDVSLKQARDGLMAILSYRVEFTDSTGEPLLTSLRTVLAR
jgi:hypothetical protein